MSAELCPQSVHFAFQLNLKIQGTFILTEQQTKI
jgi:hypothetical protein